MAASSIWGTAWGPFNIILLTSASLTVGYLLPFCTVMLPGQPRCHLHACVVHDACGFLHRPLWAADSLITVILVWCIWGERTSHYKCSWTLCILTYIPCCDQWLDVHVMEALGVENTPRPPVPPSPRFSRAMHMQELDSLIHWSCRCASLNATLVDLPSFLSTQLVIPLHME